jgi:hypothetical protein
MRTVRSIARGYALFASMLAAGLVACGCSAPPPDGTTGAKPADTKGAPAATAAAPAVTGPIDVCAIVKSDDAAALLGPLPMQPPAKTDHAGFGITACLYIGPALSGHGAQTTFAQLMIQAGRGKDASEMLADDAGKRQATETLSGGSGSAKRNAAGSFVSATKGGVYCTAEIKNGLPPSLSSDAAAAGLDALCDKVFAAAIPAR